jgi:hypothetical protein
MRHAYHGRTDQRIQVAADAFADRIVIRLSHRGTAFDPGTVRPPVFADSSEWYSCRIIGCRWQKKLFLRLI